MFSYLFIFLINKIFHVHNAPYPLAADVAPLIKFLKEIEEGTIVMMAAFDDPATKYFYSCALLPISEFSSFTHASFSLPLFRRLNDEARQLISDLGSSAISTLGFRDSWIFVGGKGIKTKTPFEQVTQARLAHNKEHQSPSLKSSMLLLL